MNILNEALLHAPELLATHNVAPTALGALAVGAVLVAGGALQGMGAVAAITVHEHRELTHRSLETSPALRKYATFESDAIAQDSRVWAAVHRLHHRYADATLYPFYKLARYAQARQDFANTAWGTAQPAMPNDFEKGILDPFAGFTLEQAIGIGKSAEAEIRDKLGDAYTPPNIEEFTEAEANHIIDTTKAKYYYPQTKKPKNQPYTQDEKARILLTDPHSPALTHPRGKNKNGVRQVLFSNIPLYRVTSKLFKDRPELMDKDLQKEPASKVEKKWLPPVAVYAANIGAVAVGSVLVRGKFGVAEAAFSVPAGAFMATVKIAIKLSGGNVTNSGGHAGQLQGIRGMYAHNRELKLSSDGSLSTDTSRAGFAGKLLSIMSLDEVGGQDKHHKNPHLIAYTLAKGWQKIKDAPWGSALQYLSARKKPVLVRPGKGFDLKEGESRPDAASESVLAIQKQRVISTS